MFKAGIVDAAKVTRSALAERRVDRGHGPDDRDADLPTSPSEAAAPQMPPGGGMDF